MISASSVTHEPYLLAQLTLLCSAHQLYSSAALIDTVLLATSADAVGSFSHESRIIYSPALVKALASAHIQLDLLLSANHMTSRLATYY